MYMFLFTTDHTMFCSITHFECDCRVQTGAMLANDDEREGNNNKTLIYHNDYNYIMIVCVPYQKHVAEFPNKWTFCSILRFIYQTLNTITGVSIDITTVFVFFADLRIDLLSAAHASHTTQ